MTDFFGLLVQLESEVAASSPQSIAPSSISLVLSVPNPSIAAGIQVSSIGQAVSLGAPQLNLSVTIGSAVGSVTLGSPTLSALMILSSASQPVALGAPVLGLSITPNSAVSAVTFGAPSVSTSQTINPTSAIGDFQLGAPSFSSVIAPASISVAATYGTPSFGLALAVAPDSISQPIATATPVLAGPVSMSSASSDVVLGTPLFGSALSVGSAQGTFSFGAPALSAYVSPTSITQVINNPSITLNQAIEPDGINVLASLGAPTIPTIVIPASIASVVNVSAPTLAGPISLSSIQVIVPVSPIRISSEVTVQSNPSSAAVDSGTQVRVFSSLIDMTNCQPDLTSGPLDNTFWQLITGQALQEFNGITLQTSSLPNSTAMVQTIEQQQYIDASVQPNVIVAPSSSTAQAIIGELGLVTTSGDKFSSAINQLNNVYTVSVQATMNGQETLNETIAIGPGRGIGKLRLLRLADRVHVFLGTRPMTTAQWLLAPASVFLRVANDSTNQGGVKIRFLDYLRQPIILIGGKPMTQFVARSGIQVIGTVPESTYIGPVDITVIGCADASETAVGSFEYIAPVTSQTLAAEPGRSAITVLRR